MRFYKIAAFLACSLLGQSVFAQTAVPRLDQDGRKGDVARLAKQKAEERFGALDKDGDGKLSRQEVEHDLPYLAKKFAERDINGDGHLDWEEFLGHKRWKK